MSQIEKSCVKYSNFEKIGKGTFGNIYKAQNKETKYYVAIKEIDKEWYNDPLNSILKESEIMNKIKTENSVSVKETIDSKDYFYIIMELCYCNLEEYIRKRENPISVNEIREVLIQLNNSFKIMVKENIIHRDLKPSNILISLDKLNKCVLKLSDYGSSNYINQTSMTKSIRGTPLTMAPEILNGENLNSKSDIWSLGVIIYFMINKEYPYNGNNEILLMKDIQSGKKLKLSEDKDLNDLLNKMLKIDVNERISWEDYFIHPFFTQDISNLQFPEFNIKCEIHSNNFNSYCKVCKKNICKKCYKEHSSHTIISFLNIGFNKNEIEKIEDLLTEIDNKINLINKIKKNIKDFIMKMKMIENNKLIYEKDEKSNYKQYIIDYLEILNGKLNVKEINLFDLSSEKEMKNKNNYITYIYDIKQNQNEYLNKPMQILNCYEQVTQKFPNRYLGYSTNNDKELSENCELYLNNNKIGFHYEYQLQQKGENNFKILLKNTLTNINLMFSDCNKLLSIDLSNFNSSKVINMSYMFYGCSSLSSIDLSNLNTSKVINMSYMFYGCSSLSSIDLLDFDTNKVIDMDYMFYGCSSLTSLDLSNFKIEQVTNMSGMFSDCSSLKSLNLSNFNTIKVKNMDFMFCSCTSLISLDLSTFNTINVINMNDMFSCCSSLENLNLSKFNTNNVKKMSDMFYNCISLKSLDLSHFNIKNVVNMESMFSQCSSLIYLNLSSFNTEKVIFMDCMLIKLDKNCQIITEDKKILGLIKKIK